MVAPLTSARLSVLPLLVVLLTPPPVGAAPPGLQGRVWDANGLPLGRAPVEVSGPRASRRSGDRDRPSGGLFLPGSPSRDVLPERHGAGEGPLPAVGDRGALGRSSADRASARCRRPRRHHRGAGTRAAPGSPTLDGDHGGAGRTHPKPPHPGTKLPAVPPHRPRGRESGRPRILGRGQSQLPRCALRRQPVPLRWGQHDRRLSRNLGGPPRPRRH